MGRLAESCKTNEDSHHELMRLGIASFNLSSVQILEKLPNKSRQNNERQRSSRQVQGGAVQFLLGLKTHLPIDYRYSFRCCGETVHFLRYSLSIA
jgi:hypothetical protein